MRRRLKRIFWSITGLVLFLLVFVVFLVGTGPGTRWVFGLALPRLPVELSIDRIEGRIAGQLDLHGIRIAQEGLELSVGHFGLDWAPFALLRGRLHVRSVLIEDVDGTVAPAPTEDAETPARPAEPRPGPIAIPLEVQFDQIEARRIGVLLPGAAEVRDVGMTLRGAATDYHLALQAQLLAEGGPLVDVDLEGGGGLDRFTLRQLSADLLDGSVDVQAELTWYPELTWDLRVEARDIEMAQLASSPEQWPGAIGLGLRSRGNVADGVVQGTAVLDSLSGSLRGLELGGAGTIRFAGSQAQVDRLHAQWGNLRLDAHGEIRDELDVDLSIECPQLSALELGWEGELGARARVEGPLKAPRARVSLLAQAIAGAGISLERLEMDARGSADLADSQRVTLVVSGLQQGGQSISRASLRAEGTASDHRIDVESDAAISTGEAPMQAAFILGVQGGLDLEDSAWSGQISSLSLSADSLGTWALDTPTPLRLSPTEAALDSLCLVREQTTLCMSGAWRAPMQWDTSVDLAQLPLDITRPFLPEGRSLSGSLSASLAARADSSRSLFATSALALDGARLVIVDLDRADTLLFEPARLDLRVGETGAAVQVGASVRNPSAGELGSFEAELSLPEFRSLEDSIPLQPLVGRVRADVPDLAFVDALSPALRGTGGSISADLELGGTVGMPEARGKVQTSDLRTEFPELGLAFQDVRFDATGDARSGFEMSGTLRSGEGSLTLEGRIPTQPSAEQPARLAVRGERFLVMNTAEVESEISPDLEILFNGDRLDVQGLVRIPRTEVELVEVPPSAVGVSPDIVVVGPESAPSAPPLKTGIDVTVELGDEVYFRGFGAFAHLEGTLRVREELPEPPSGSGEIRIVDGSYRAYGQNLQIEDGRVIFSGPLSTPRLDIKAFRIADDGTEAGVHVRGTPEQPELRVYSDPAMSEGRAVNYLLTGRAPDGGSGTGNTAALLGSNVLSTRMSSSLGLDEARVEGDSLDESTLVAGKYISPQLYLAYAKSLYDSTRALRIRYLFSRSWSVQAETGSTMGADIFYNFELGGQ